MHKENENINRGKICKEVPNINHRDDKYNKWTEKFNHEIQQLTGWSRIKHLWTVGQDGGIYPIRGITRNLNQYSIRNI